MLAEDAKKFGLNGKVYLSVKTALDAARKKMPVLTILFLLEEALLLLQKLYNHLNIGFLC